MSAGGVGRLGRACRPPVTPTPLPPHPRPQSDKTNLKKLLVFHVLNDAKARHFEGRGCRALAPPPAPHRPPTSPSRNPPQTSADLSSSPTLATKLQGASVKAASRPGGPTTFQPASGGPTATAEGTDIKTASGGVVFPINKVLEPSAQDLQASA